MQRRGESGQPVKGRRHRAATPKARKAPTARLPDLDLQEQLDQRTRERDEAREQQTATAEILRVIRASPTDVQPVFDMIAESASRLCEAQFCFVYRFDGQLLHFVAHHSVSPKVVEINRRAYPQTPSRKSVAARAILEQSVVQISDVNADPDYALGELAAACGYRSGIGIPILRDGVPVGSIAIARAEAGLFPNRQVELLKTFADQAVIAIENVRLFNETKEALEQQTATSEVLKVISSSPGELEPVFKAILENATRICEAKFGTLYLREADGLRTVATHNAPTPYVEDRKRNLVRPPADSALGQVLKVHRVTQVADITAVKSYVEGDPYLVSAVKLGGYRTIAAVPMLKDNSLIGAITINRQEVRPFTDKQIELVQNFAAQAVIAIENARLLNELRQRTDDLSESLEQQTATSEVLKVISSSAGALEPVFNAMLENATRICEAKFGNLWLREGDDGFRSVAVNGESHYAEWSRQEPVVYLRDHPGAPLDRVHKTRKVVHIPDLRLDESYRKGDPRLVALADTAGARSQIVVPMLKDAELIGAIVIYRTEVRPFSDKQIELLCNFAAQAVIAIENARLLNELRQRTDDLAESLDQQTATAEILQVINSSPGDLAPVFDTLAERAMRLCEADYGHVYTYDGELFHLAAAYGEPRYVDWIRQSGPRPPKSSLTLEGIVAGERFMHIGDIAKEEAYRRSNSRARTIVDKFGIHTLLTVALRRDDALLGAFVLYRQVARPFSDKQIALVQNFAAQAVIAMENARLLDEIRQRQAELRVTFENMGDGVAMFDEVLRLAAWNRNFQELLDLPAEFLAERPVYADYARFLARRGEFGPVDVEAELRRYEEKVGQQWSTERTRPDGRVVEVRHNPVPGGGFVLIYSDITERKRAEEEIRAARDTAEAMLGELRTAQDRLVQTEKLASLGQLTAGIAHEIKNPLNFVNNFSAVSAEMIDELQDVLSGMSIDQKARTEIKELTDALRGNLEKVVQHGKRADAIVKNMLLHSREGSGEHRPVDVNALVEESLNLAYHGARAEKQGFTITLQRSFDPTVGEADIFPQDITRALLNLIINGFYAATKRRAETNGGNYEPTLAAATKNLGDRVEITIRDNGIGIPPDVKAKIFNPFFTTKPAGEGTGLGLSISHDIIVKQHGGSIEVDTQPGEFTEIRVILPRAAALLPERS